MYNKFSVLINALIILLISVIIIIIHIMNMKINSFNDRIFWLKYRNELIIDKNNCLNNSDTEFNNNWANLCLEHRNNLVSICNKKGGTQYVCEDIVSFNKNCELPLDKAKQIKSLKINKDNKCISDFSDKNIQISININL